MMNNKGGLMDLPIQLLYAFIVITMFVALIPGFTEILGTAQSSTNLNCHGYVNYDDPTQSANSSRVEASSIACIAIKLYLPYLVLGVLIAVVTFVIMGKGIGGQSAQEPMY